LFPFPIVGLLNHDEPRQTPIVVAMTNPVALEWHQTGPAVSLCQATSRSDPGAFFPGPQDPVVPTQPRPCLGWSLPRQNPSGSTQPDQGLVGHCHDEPEGFCRGSSWFNIPTRHEI